MKSIFWPPLQFKGLASPGSIVQAVDYTLACPSNKLLSYQQQFHNSHADSFDI